MFSFFGSFAPPGKMMQGKSSLNAYAVPYVPISKKSCIGESWAANKIVGFSGKSEDVGVAAGCHFPGNVSQEQSLEKLQVSDETYASEKLSMMDDSNKVEFLVWRFRGYCPESLSDFLKFNNGDLYDTIDFLEEFEVLII